MKQELVVQRNNDFHLHQAFWIIPMEKADVDDKTNSSLLCIVKKLWQAISCSILSAFVTRAEPDSGLSIAFALDFCVFQTFRICADKIRCSHTQEKAQNWAFTSYIVHACISVEKQYQMTHTARTYISDPLCISITHKGALTYRESPSALKTDWHYSSAKLISFGYSQHCSSSCEKASGSFPSCTVSAL